MRYGINISEVNSRDFAGAFKELGLDYVVVERSGHYYGVDGVEYNIPNKVLIRNDNNEFLGIVGDTYSIVQNHQVFSILDDKDVVFEEGGTFQSGAQAFMVLRGVTININNIDYNLRVLIRNSFNGSWAMTMKVLTEVGGLPVCGLDINFKKKHTKTGLVKFIGQSELVEYIDALTNIISAASKVEYTLEQAYGVAEQLLKNDGRLQEFKDKLAKNFDGTAWGIILGASEYVQDRDDVDGEKALKNVENNYFVERVKKVLGIAV